uniref:Integrase zinc-binding domain-containing protein n=1 Tax=Cannabis sativa TaxID=3483 RepID=A0A803P434_CANSA
MEVYVDDLLVKSKTSEDHGQHLEEAFTVIKKHWMKLNPMKYGTHLQLPEFWRASRGQGNFYEGPVVGSRYVIMDGKLYRREESMPYLTCIARTEISSVIHEIHGGFCGNHTSEPSLSKKILHKGCFLPTMKKNCIEYVRKCEQCQWYAKVLLARPTKITLMSSPWSFVVL